MQPGFANRYLSKFQCNFFIEPEQFLPFDMVVVIPCYNEPDIANTLDSVFGCESTGISTAIVVVINSSADSPIQVIEQNRKSVKELSANDNSTATGKQLFVLQVENLPEKHGGVGWARKIGMDWAVAQFNHAGHSDGVIVSLDADSTVEKNYLRSIYSYFRANQTKVAATIYFEHRSPAEREHSNDEELGAVLYELYMRYYRNALMQTGFPAAIYTVGSCFAVRVSAYIAQGGMNRRKAGEDFYFLQKLTMFGDIGEINSTTVFPSSRRSNRVPFGTGPIINNYCEGDRTLETTYPLELFLMLKPFFSRVNDFYLAGATICDEYLTDEPLLLSFFKSTHFTREARELATNCGSSAIFGKRFFHLFNAFSVLKWLNFAVLHSVTRKNLLKECSKLLQIMGIAKEKIPDDPKLMLNLFRQIDKDGTIH
jgi:glycosyltransferase involved in cell wall biosynthesis